MICQSCALKRIINLRERRLTMKYINIDTEGFYDMKDFDGEE